MSTACEACRNGETFDLPFSVAFQPIVDLNARRVFGHEALVRGVNGEGASSVLTQVNDKNRYYFDQQCRVTAIEMAAGLFPPGDDLMLSINFMPNAVYEPRACIRTTLATAEKADFPLQNILFEFTENEKLDTEHILKIVKTYQAMGFKTAIDDFGAGYAGLNMLAEFNTDIVKFDMDLARGIDRNSTKQKIMRHSVAMMKDLGIVTLCEGIETREELDVLQDIGVDLFQGYFFSKPAFEALADPRF